MKNTTIQSKLILVSIMALLLSFSARAQDVIGAWEGVIKFEGQEIPILFDVAEEDGVLVSTMDSPSGGAIGIPMDKTTFENNQLTVIFSQGGIKYVGDLEKESIIGIFYQAGMELPLNLTKTVKTKPGDLSLPSSDETLRELAAFDNGMFHIEKRMKKEKIMFMSKTLKRMKYHLQ